MTQLASCIENLIQIGTVQNISVRVGRNDQILYDLYRSPNNTVNENTLFDMASVTKILATTSLALMALDRNLLSLEDPVAKFFRCDAEKEKLTIFNLLTHTIGIGYKPLFKEEPTCDTIADTILKIPCDIPIGSDVLYSCPAFILLGKILENVFEKPFQTLFDELVCKPLNLASTRFCPQDKTNIVNSNLDHTMLGQVNDNNCRFLGGIAGNAGVFSNITDMTAFAKYLLRKGAPIIRQSTFENAVLNHTPQMSAARGLGFLYVDERYTQTGSLFPVGSIGHCGHTGQSVFVDFKTGLYVIILSDATISTVKKYGNEHYGEVMQMRADLHNAIKQDLKESI